MERENGLTKHNNIRECIKSYNKKRGERKKKERMETDKWSTD